ncbi:MAG: hypothetical protein CV089_09310 [Nitrospira sp. WS110]|nr:hypothetical protein [Nitrospira sp. WS110]
MKMETSDDFANLLFEEAKAFLGKHDLHKEENAAVAYLHAALLLGFCALEAHINNVAADFADRPEFTLLEQGIMQEKDVALKHGEFELTKTLKMFRLEDRYEFLYRRFKKRPIDKDVKWWGLLKAGLQARNAITHPRTPSKVTSTEVAGFLSAILEAIDALFRAVYRKPYPCKRRKLDSTLEF